MKEILWIIALLSLSPLSVVCENSSSIKCNGELGFCGTELYDCLKSRILNEEMNPCNGLSYPDLYKDRMTDAPFVVSSSNSGDSKLKYGLIAINKTEYWSPVKKCCNLTLNEPCQLRPTLPGEHFTLFATNGKAFCVNMIGEYPTVELQWCSVVNKPPCLFFENDGILIRKEFEDVSTTRVYYRSQYCFFEVSAKVVLGNVSKDGLIHNVSGIQKLEDKVETIMGHVVQCDMKKMNGKNFDQYLRDYKIKPHNAICFFVRLDEGNYWSSTPMCKRSNLRESWMTILLVLCVLIFVVIVLIILGHKIRKYIPSYHDTEKDISKYMPRIEENEDFLTKPTDNNLDYAANELPDKISPCELIAKKDEAGLGDEACDENVVQNKKNVNSYEEKELTQHMESTCGMEAIGKCNHISPYCAKEDVPLERGNISSPDTETQLVSSSAEYPDDSVIAEAFPVVQIHHKE